MLKHYLDSYCINLENILCENLAQYSSIRHYTYNETLYQKGDAPHNLYIFLSGQLKVYKDTQHVIDCIGGELIGAYANFANIRYFETIKFFSPGDILIIPFDYFKEKIIQYPILYKEVINVLSQKQKIIGQHSMLIT